MINPVIVENRIYVHMTLMTGNEREVYALKLRYQVTNHPLCMSVVYIKRKRVRISWQNLAGGKQKSYKVIRINTPDIENIRGLNLAVVKLTPVQVTKLPL
jgi:hypothetical protein